MANVFDVARYFLTKVNLESGDFMTHLKLQKISYYAQAIHLAINDRPLFEGRFEAWAHGPVNTDLFYEYREFGWHPIPYPWDFDENVLEPEEKYFLDTIWDVFGKYGAKHLEDMTHQELPWIEARGGLPEGAKCSNVISDTTMKQYYRRLIVDATDEKKILYVTVEDSTSLFSQAFDQYGKHKRNSTTNRVTGGDSLMAKYQVILTRDEDGMYVVECPAIPGCVSEGETVDEAIENIKEAIQGCLEVRREYGMPLTVDVLEVEV